MPINRIIFAFAGTVILVSLALSQWHKQGASRAEVLETMGMAIYMGAGPSVMYAAQTFEAFDQFSGKTG